MKNTNADWYCKIAYAWCGNALLWRSGLFDYFPNPNERWDWSENKLPVKSAQGGSIPPLHTILKKNLS